MSRTALLIRCAATQAEKIRNEAVKRRLTLSSYVLQVAGRTVEFEDEVYSKNPTPTELPVIDPKQLIEPGPRTAILVRCEDSEAQRIRDAARRRETPINVFVLYSLKRAWNGPMRRQM